MTTPLSPDRFNFRVWDGAKMRGPFGRYDLAAVSRALQTDRSTFPQYDLAPEPNPAAVVMQSTGFEDATGREVFEGDIVTGVLGGPVRYLVGRDDASGGWSFTAFLPGEWRDDDGPFGEEVRHMYVEGNVHETPQLASTAAAAP